MTVSSAEGRLRLTILGGFLGSGKTTWLRHHLYARGFAAQHVPVHVIVNEAAEAPVDDALLSGADGITLLAGASVCGAGQQALQEALLDLCDRRSKTADPAQRLDRIVLETSGLTDPSAVLQLIQTHPILVRQIVVEQTIVIVDALNAAAQMQQEALCRRQIEAADQVILTKTDLASEPAIAQLRATLHHLAPAAAQSAAQFGNTCALPALAPDQARLDLPELADDTGPPILASQLDLGAQPDWTAFTVWLSALLYARGDQIVRVKGVVRSPAGRLLLQAVRRSVQSPEILPEPDRPCATDNTLAVIGRGFAPDQLARSLARLTA